MIHSPLLSYPLKIHQVTLLLLRLQLKVPFQSVVGTLHTRPVILVAVRLASGALGWGECVALPDPHYTAETVGTAWHILHDFICPRLLGQTLTHPNATTTLLQPIRGNPMAKAAAECAVWAAWAAQQQQPLGYLLGGKRASVPVGVSLGQANSLPQLLEQAAYFVAQGYRRLKLKIQPGWDLEPLQALRLAYPDLALMADANSAYRLTDLPTLQALDELDLQLLEQPLAHDDLAQHAQLQAALRTPICLDESIHSLADAQLAVQLHACRVLNLKVGRVGGIQTALQILQLCQTAGVAVWCGGMFETGIGRALNLHLASLPGFSLSNDISASDRYYQHELLRTPFTLNPDSTITVPSTASLGVTLRPAQIVRACERFVRFR